MTFRGLLASAATAIAVWGGSAAAQIDMTVEEMDALLADSLAQSGQGAFYDVLSNEYASDYYPFIEETVAMLRSGALQEAEMFGWAQQFTNGLRQRDAQFLASAPLENLYDMNAATLALMLSLQADHPEICGRFAAMGGGALTLMDMQFIDQNLIGNIAAETFRALANGRDKPITQQAATPAELDQMVADWSNDHATPAGALAALGSMNFADPAFCAANISFSQYVDQTRTELMDRVIVNLQVVANGI